MRDMAKKVAFITGGASGIGKATCLAFARRGASVAVADIDVPRGSELAASIVASGGRSSFLQVDVADPASVQRGVSEAVVKLGGLDYAFNNAGMTGRHTTAMTCETDEWDRVTAVNMRGVWLCMKYQIAIMMDRGGGAIVNNASRAGMGAGPNDIAYVTTKHAVVGMTRSAAIDFAKHNIRVNALLPGCTDTPMFRAAVLEVGLEPNAVAGSMAPLGRMGRPDEQAEAVVWLCSDSASYVTGAMMAVDGGMSASI